MLMMMILLQAMSPEPSCTLSSCWPTSQLTTGEGADTLSVLTTGIDVVTGVMCCISLFPASY